ncbi:hypothetical protein CAPTEDRAFT_146340 [Capitella teleta]|uniref:Sidoreflexin n=2 Tax=Capitella teleta TaxID=283909 RepID=R7UYD5_CAPTE|nr:hypothetical protein CAPTEDRAFT_146340 [Capitella teleta]|eukprot:ELU08441.1 hypothetical protein CAPTEDRAFT_146340 [Capitella teleta]
MGENRINLNEPRFDQGTYTGRAKHFFNTTNPLNLFASGADLEKAKLLVNQYRQGIEPSGTTDDQVWRAKNLYDSAFHPDTGEKMFMLGRMSAQVPVNMTITGCMMTFYRTTPAVIFWQWFNQSFNAVVNYTNRSGDSPISTGRLGLSYALGTSVATGTAVGLNHLVKSAPPIVGRYVPFVAVCAANCINIPCMRNTEISQGIPVFTEDGTRVGDSPAAAKRAISQVLLSRIVMACPGMWIPPVIMQRMEKGAFLKKYPMMNAPIQVGLVGFFLIFATPLCCALFPQKSSMAASALEDDLKQKLKDLGKSEDRVYFNKGL